MAYSQEIEDKAKKLLDESGMAGVYPVDLHPISQHLGYTTYNFKPSNDESMNVSGAVIYKEKKIMINDSEPFERRRFTQAHEIGHIYLHHEDKDHVDFRGSFNSNHNFKEQEANAFGAALLMPENEFRKQRKNYRDYYFLAKYFVVSPDAARIRAINLGCCY